MNTWLIVVLVLIILFLVRRIFIRGVKRINKRIWQRREAKGINKLLLYSYLGEGKSELLKKLNKRGVDIIISQYDIGNYNYLVMENKSKKTSFIFQFKENICTGFFLKAGDKKQSLITRKYITYYGKIKNSGLPHPASNLNLSEYSIVKYLQPYRNREIELRDEIQSVFKRFFEVDNDRYLSIEIDAKESQSSPNPVFLYLCSSQIEHMIEFMKTIEAEYMSEFIV